jgi:hypothetical protein
MEVKKLNEKKKIDWDWFKVIILTLAGFNIGFLIATIVSIVEMDRIVKILANV